MKKYLTYLGFIIVPLLAAIPDDADDPDELDKS